mmetsp:Transcript_502/g.1003  ORF Transcript_502/g.1003 Transcript_502/m.1003 type:complete len:186 (+) Transcript_502:81-638(+)
MQEESPAMASVDDQEEPSNLDPLENGDETATTTTTTAEMDRAAMADASQYTQEELVEILSKVTQVDFSDEYMDPIEWSVRKVVPLPAVYFWDLLKDVPEDVAQQIVQDKIPRKIRMWHRFIGTMDRAQHFVNDWVAQPIAGTLGITDARISYVTDTMTEEDMQKSKRLVAERKRRQEENAAKESA